MLKLTYRAYLIIKGGVVIQASYKGWEYKFYFPREGSVYFTLIILNYLREILI